MKHRAHTAGSLAVLFLCLCAGCGEDEEAGGLRPSRYAWDYSGPYGKFQIADTAEAFSGQQLIGRARLVELLGSPTGKKRTLKIEVTHFDAAQHPVYSGYIYVEPAFTTGRLIREEAVSGHQTAAIFKGWQFGR